MRTSNLSATTACSTPSTSLSERQPTRLTRLFADARDHHLLSEPAGPAAHPGAAAASEHVVVRADLEHGVDRSRARGLRVVVRRRADRGGGQRWIGPAAGLGAGALRLPGARPD